MAGPVASAAPVTDETAMRAAIDLARGRLGLTGDNPAVGCVIVRDGRIIAAAATMAGGRPHAEEQALAAAGDVARGGRAFVTLEPCGERSSGAASCAERLVAAGVATVVIAVEDPSPKASGRGLALLETAGVVVRRDFLKSEAEGLYADYAARLAAGG